ncbi:MAG: P-II family nitrogen regulator [Bacteroidetes bacterium]|jgi:nitrogen regulatory protein P-II 1|nr:P-II family nitrogen regulator [Bacteroidota bacterium]MBT5531020.1 P-II family nitrogen regulator [Cytophagia bacterium]MBT3421876.1 P-II family nitrogen regulator [Bacteroidota bacterium]MBT3802388.1 P-II family nitrogen regulator [Bacteroidota bacterium]MBT3934534.1 P-II family nitrogen regulator [Bacteroidota bacterium]
MQFKLIMAFVKPNITDAVVDAVKEAGATGATIIPARGTGMHEAKSFFGLSIEAQTDIIVFLVEEHVVENLMKVIQLAGKFDKPGTGIAFVLPVEHIAGLDTQMKKFKDQARDKYF